MKRNTQSVENDRLASDLAALSYPGVSYLTPCSKGNPAEVVLSALQVANLDSRVVEALPWVLLQCPDLDWRWLVREARLNELQNKLGFLTSLARRVAEASGLPRATNQLKEWEAVLERARLLREETLCHDSLTQAERTWLRSNRSKEAEYWDLLTDLSPEHLRHIDLNPEPETTSRYSHAMPENLRTAVESLTGGPLPLRLVAGSARIAPKSRQLATGTEGR